MQYFNKKNIKPWEPEHRPSKLLSAKQTNVHLYVAYVCVLACMLI